LTGNFFLFYASSGLRGIAINSFEDYVGKPAFYIETGLVKINK
jgi:hypothetical protein